MNQPGTIIAVADTRMHPTHFLKRKGNVLFHEPTTNTLEPLPLLEDASPTWFDWSREVPIAHIDGLSHKEAQAFTPKVDKELLRRSLNTRTACVERVDLALLINTLGGTRWASQFFSDVASFAHETGGQVRAYVTSAAVSTGFLLLRTADRLQAHPRAFIAHHMGAPGAGTREAYVERLGAEEADRRIAILMDHAKQSYEEAMTAFVERSFPAARASLRRRFDAAAATPDRWASFDGETLFDAGVVDILADKSGGIAREIAEDTNRSVQELLAVPSLRRFFEHSRIEGKLRRLHGLYGSTVRYDGRDAPFVMPNNELYATMDRSILKEAQATLESELP